MPVVATAAACLGANTADALVEGRLATGRAAAAEAHLADCGDCRLLVAALARPPRTTLPPTEDPAAAALRPRRGDAVGRYWIQGPLGEGGMGVVYRATDPELGRHVAIKLLHARPGAEAEARLLREARAVAQLSHPHVIQVYEVGVWRQQVFLAMECVEGATLRAHLADARPSWREIHALFVAAGRALAAAHAVGLVHRDFKPDNVLVGADGRVRVSDFGLARQVLGDDAPAAGTSAAGAATLTRTGAVLGTPRYMSPEQRAGKVASPRSDQYSFCLAFAEALAEASPPARLVRVLARGLRETPLERHASMAALLEALEAAARPRRAGAALAGLLLVAAAGVAMVRTAARAPAAPPRALRELRVITVPLPVVLPVRAPQPPPSTAARSELRIEATPTAEPSAPPPDYVVRGVRAQLPELRRCYDEARRTAPSLEGLATAHFVIRADGTVGDEVRILGLDHLYATSCLARVFRALRFPAAADGAALTVRYPLRFTRPSRAAGSAP